MNEADIQVTLSGVVSFLILIIAISSIWRGIKVVPQSEEYTIERFGKYTKTLDAGLNFIVPFLDQICRRWPAIVFERGCEIKEPSPKR
jgi:regulator of protease activity HflC (stomatin/prohibitin superfamily)